jgi:hypothetical protein
VQGFLGKIEVTEEADSASRRHGATPCDKSLPSSRVRCRPSSRSLEACSNAHIRWRQPLRECSAIVTGRSGSGTFALPRHNSSSGEPRIGKGVESFAPVHLGSDASDPTRRRPRAAHDRKKDAIRRAASLSTITAFSCCREGGSLGRLPGRRLRRHGGAGHRTPTGSAGRVDRRDQLGADCGQPRRSDASSGCAPSGTRCRPRSRWKFRCTSIRCVLRSTA